MKEANNNTLFSDQLNQWLHSSSPKTIESLTDFFGQKSFAVVILILMVVPALPIPAVGISYVLESLSLILSIELAAGMAHIWLPRRWRHMQLHGVIINRAMPRLVKIVREFESWPAIQWTGLSHNPLVIRITAIIMVIFSIASLLAPPLTGLDTIPALGIVILCLSIILENTLTVLAGFMIGLIGVAIEVGIGGLIIKLIAS